MIDFKHLALWLGACLLRSAMNKYYIGVEIGGTKQQICIGYGDGTIALRKSVKLGKVTATEILAWIEDTINKLMEEYEVEGIGVGFGGPLELATGRVLSSLQVPGWENFKLKEWFEARWDVNICVANDTFTGGFGELICGAGKGSDRLLYTNIGTGIGGGLYFDGKGFDGSGFGAAYVGNTLIPDWRPGTKPGDMTRTELIVSGKSIVDRLSTPGYVPETSMMYEAVNSGEGFRVSEVLGGSVLAGDEFATEELDKITESFAIALANVLAITGVTRIVVGGGVANMGDVLMDRIRAKTDEIAFIANKGAYEIRVSELLDDAVLVGALILADRAKELII